MCQTYKKNSRFSCRYFFKLVYFQCSLILCKSMLIEHHITQWGNDSRCKNSNITRRWWLNEIYKKRSAERSQPGHFLLRMTTYFSWFRAISARLLYATYLLSDQWYCNVTSPMVTSRSKWGASKASFLHYINLTYRILKILCLKNQDTT